jgi:peptidoglycan biosynthesis protein MviN/MurJ (putative lipid II flippase)
VHSPLRSMAVRVGTSAVFMVPAWLVHGPNVLPLLGLALSAGSLVGAAHVWWRLRRSLPATKPEKTERVGRSLIRTAAASLLMIVPAVAAAWAVGTLPHTHVTSILGVVAAAVVGAVVYFALQARWRAPEIGWLKTGAAGLGRPATDEADEVDP